MVLSREGADMFVVISKVSATLFWSIMQSQPTTVLYEYHHRGCFEQISGGAFHASCASLVLFREH